MGYSIQYGPGKNNHKTKTTTGKKRHGHWYAIWAAVIIPCLILLLFRNPTTADNSELVPLPRRSQTVRDAFSDFSDSVRSGEKFSDALECLYRQMLERGEPE